jgi:hypothetical protein
VNILLKREELTRRWRKLCDAEVQRLYYCLDAIRVIESMNMISAFRAVGMGQKTNDAKS